MVHVDLPVIHADGVEGLAEFLEVRPVIWGARGVIFTFQWGVVLDARQLACSKLEG